MIRIFKTGTHAHRTPLSYPALARLFDDHIELVATPAEADLYVFAHSLDIQNAPRALAEDWQRRQRPLLLLSEEPFWDTIWARQPLASWRLVDSRWGPLPVHQLSHQTSDIFRFERIPYYLLTNHRFANAYATKFTRNAKRSVADWRQHFRQAPCDLTFMFERRPEPYHSVGWPEGGLFGLAQWRTRVAELCQQGRIDRLGRSWQKNTPPRGQLTDWHLDKLSQLDGQSRVLAAFENTHQAQYISEKIFDAFACGALPLYVADPGHRLHDLGLPPAAWINLCDHSPEEAAQSIDALDWQDDSWLEEMLCAYSAAQQNLADLLANPRNWQRERHRLQRALLRDFTRLLDTHSPLPGPLTKVSGSAAAPITASAAAPPAGPRP